MEIDSIGSGVSSYGGGDYDFSPPPVDAPEAPEAADVAPEAPAAPEVEVSDGFDPGPVSRPFATAAAGEVDDVAAERPVDGAGSTEDAFEDSPAAEVGAQAAAVVRPMVLGPSISDKDFDGLLVGRSGEVYPRGTPLADLPAVEPAGGVRNGETIIYTNGILTNRELQSDSLQAIANQTGSRVVGVHNATEGAIKDLLQCVDDKLDDSLGRNPAVDTLASTVYDELKAGRDVHLIGHSQGGLITSRALSDVRDRLMVEDGMSRKDAEALMGRITAETFGAAATSYPDGPKYTHNINRFDVVPNLVGLGEFANISPFSHPGRGAKVNYFSDWQGGVTANHAFDTTYLRHRVAP